ncbi:dolichyl-phosphate beta-glucosyltransferase [Desulfocicer vacuolatum DSM 3385]|uniref:Dolichyl-phosphate beta-glucosyltransferase n=1 Tax=Desulfocicer vacuolatum DSM 3385 TaxID=1121400 RepID=A0A1W2DKR3_9BACT|nr:dolichyl-phosphate beta-glucosyltransferase [Desulfocicer vacuolatum DSM 3385]
MNNFDGLTNKIHISIVVPFYNEEEGIKRVCEEILSVASNHFGTSWELILVNDGSSDNTPYYDRRHCQKQCQLPGHSFAP